MRNQSSIKMLALTLLVTTLITGCGGLLFVGVGLGVGLAPRAITFETGELRTTEEATLAELDSASRSAIEAIGCDIIEVQRNPEHVRWQAQTAGGDPVEIDLTEKSRNKTELRIRIGVLGDEARSRLILEEIQQSLAQKAQAEHEKSQAQQEL